MSDLAKAVTDAHREIARETLYRIDECADYESRQHAMAEALAAAEARGAKGKVELVAALENAREFIDFVTLEYEDESRIRRRTLVEIDAAIAAARLA